MQPFFGILNKFLVLKCHVKKLCGVCYFYNFYML